MVEFVGLIALEYFVGSKNFENLLNFQKQAHRVSNKGGSCEGSD